MDWLIPCDSPVDVVVIGAHPDDAEMHVGGMLVQIARGGRRRIGLVDLSRGEAGTRGTPEQRRDEALAAAKLLPGSCRVILGLPDGGIEDGPEARRLLVTALRILRPRLALIQHEEDHHPDHRGAARLSRSALYFSGLANFAPEAGPRHYIHRVLGMVGRARVLPDTVVDITDAWDAKLELMRCHVSQFGQDRPSDGPASRLNDPEFLPMFESRHRTWGALVHVKYGEPLVGVNGPIGLASGDRLLD